MTRSLSDRQALEDATLAELRRAIARGMCHAHRARSAHALGVSHHMALHAILGREPMSQRAISEAFGVTPARVTGIMDDLERLRAVRRERNPSDRREMLVRSTPEALALHRQFHRSMLRQMTGLFRGLSDAELETLVGLLRRIADDPTLRSPPSPNLGPWLPKFIPVGPGVPGVVRGLETRPRARRRRAGSRTPVPR